VNIEQSQPGSQNWNLFCFDWNLFVLTAILLSVFKSSYDTNPAALQQILPPEAMAILPRHLRRLQLPRH